MLMDAAILIRDLKLFRQAGRYGIAHLVVGRAALGANHSSTSTVPLHRLNQDLIAS
jgi:hypothetical protein